MPKVFVYDFIAEFWKVFRLENDVFVGAYVKNLAYSLQISFSSQKAKSLTEALYLNFSADRNSLPLFFGFSEISSLF